MDVEILDLKSLISVIGVELYLFFWLQRHFSCIVVELEKIYDII